MLLDAFIGHEVNVHPIRHLLGPVIAVLVGTCATAPTQQPGRSTPDNHGEPKRGRAADWGSDCVARPRGPLGGAAASLQRLCHSLWLVRAGCSRRLRKRRVGREELAGWF